MSNGHDQHGGLPKEVLELLSEKLGVPISDIHVVNGGELNPSDIFGPDDEDEEALTALHTRAGKLKTIC
jgi:uncharacterized protein YggU (UPF0235/DUF167 family)